MDPGGAELWRAFFDGSPAATASSHLLLPLTMLSLLFTTSICMTAGRVAHQSEQLLTLSTHFTTSYLTYFSTRTQLAVGYKDYGDDGS